jgi:ribulose-phosphate 3-epimerase
MIWSPHDRCSLIRFWFFVSSMATRPTLVAASILSADLGRLQEEVSSLEGHADWIQVDVMDGHFVSNLTFGAPVLKCLKTKLPLDIHLMVSNPADRVGEFLSAGASHITFHAEAVAKTEDRKTLIKAIRDGSSKISG